MKVAIGYYSACIQRGDTIENNKDFQFWQQYSHPAELSTSEMLDQRLEYIHLNPVAAGFVDTPEAWIYSSARDYSGLAKGLISLEFI